MTPEPGQLPAGLDELVARICVQRAAMPDRLRIIADGFIARPRELAVMSISEVAETLKVAPSALVRFGKSLGFDGFASMQKLLRQSVAASGDGYRERLRTMAADGRRRDIDYLFDAFSGANVRALEAARQTIDFEDVSRLVARMRRARLIGVLGAKRAFPLAAYLHYGLLRLDMPSLLLDGIGGMSEGQMATFGARDVLITISFSPYATEVVALTEAAVARSVPVLSISDSPEAPIARCADVAVFVREGTINDIRAIAVTSTLIQTIFVALGLNDAQEARGGH